MKKYTVLTAVERGTNDKDHKRFEAGATIDLDDEAAAPLLAVGAIGDPIELDEKQAAPLLESGDVVEASVKSEAEAPTEAPVKAEVETPAKAPAKAKK